MATILQTIFSNSIIPISLKFDPNEQHVIGSLDNGLASNKQEAIIWMNLDLVCCRMYASLGLNELIIHLSYFKIDLLRAL